MFEKESVYHCNEVFCSICENRTCTENVKCREWRDRRAGFYCGAEFGYNKANEWHYPSKGEYPIDKTEMLVYFKYADYEYPCKTFGFYNGHFWDTKRGDVSNKEVIAWKEIVLPKEIKEK